MVQRDEFCDPGNLPLLNMAPIFTALKLMHMQHWLQDIQLYCKLNTEVSYFDCSISSLPNVCCDREERNSQILSRLWLEDMQFVKHEGLSGPWKK